MEIVTICTILYFILMITNFSLIITYKSDYINVECRFIDYVSYNSTNSIIGESITTIIYYNLYKDYGNKYNGTTLTNKIFYGDDIYIDNGEYILKYTKPNKVYDCYYKRNNKKFVYLNNPEKYVNSFWFSFIIVFIVFTILPSIIIACKTCNLTGGSGRGRDDDYDIL